MHIFVDFCQEAKTDLFKLPKAYLGPKLFRTVEMVEEM